MSESTTTSYESNKTEETPFVNKLIDENTNLKQQLLTLSAELRSLRAKPGSVENFTEEIEALSSAIKSLRSISETQTIEAARRKISKTVDLHVQQQLDNADLPVPSSPSSTGNSDSNSESSPTRIQSLENSMLSETERKALKQQRERIKKSIEENLGGAERIDQLVEEELQKRRRDKLSRQLEHESFARGANVLNTSSSSSGKNKISSSPSPLSLLTTSTSSSSAAADAAATNFQVSPIRVPRPPLPTDEEYKQMIADEDKMLSAQREENARRVAQEEAERNESLASVLSNPRDFSISREREEKQQMIIGNSTPLRSALVKAQEDAFKILKRDLEAEDATNSGEQQKDAAMTSEEYRRKTEEKLQALQDLEKYHSEMLQKGHCSAAALSV